MNSSSLSDPTSDFRSFFLFGSPLVATIHDVLSDRRIEELLSAAADRLEEPKTISSSDARVKTNPASRTGKVSSVVRITKFDDFFGACDVQ